MKKSLKVSLCLALAVMLLVCAAMAAEAPEVAKDDAISGLTITPADTGAITVTVPSALAPSGEYVVMVVKPVSTVTGDTAAALLASAKAKAAAGTTPYEVSESTILYIDQNTASSGVAFTGIPKSGDGIIILTGGDSVQILGAVKTHGVTITGTVALKGATAATAVKVEALDASGAMLAETTATTAANGTGTYTLDGVPADAVKLKVSTAAKYVTREYAITADTTEQNVELWPKGDVNGDGVVNVGDFTQVLRHVKSILVLDDYKFICADVNSDEVLNIGDFTQVLRHVKGARYLW